MNRKIHHEALFNELLPAPSSDEFDLLLPTELARKRGDEFTGSWVAFSGLALFAVEQFSYEKMMERNFDTLDGLIEAQQQQDYVARFDEGSPQPQPGARSRPRSMEESEGVPTGIAPELEALIARRRKRANSGTRSAEPPAGQAL